MRVLLCLGYSVDAAIFQNGSISYTVRGVCGNAVSMKVILTAATNDNNHAGRLDLYAARSRKAFAAAAAAGRLGSLELDAEKIKNHLLELRAVLLKKSESQAVFLNHADLHPSGEIRPAGRARQDRAERASAGRKKRHRFLSWVTGDQGRERK